MFISIARNILFIFAFFALAGFILWLWLRFWYFRLVSDARSQICDRNGQEVPGSLPRMLVGNLVDVYSSSNHLSAYNSFHEQFGEIVQIFWMWRQQISISNYAMARQILVANQRNYEKFPPNSLIQRLFGKSVLTNSGDDWKRHRLLLNEVFSQKSIAGFHDIFVEYSERLVRKWDGYIDRSQESTKFDIYPEMLALFLDIVGKVSIGRDFAALEGEADDFLDRLKYIVQQSTRPLHQFTKWWKHLPLASNRKLESAFTEIDDFLYTLIGQRKENGNSYSSNVLDLLLQAKYSLEDNLQPLTDKEIRDNLLAIIVNGHETVATSVSFSLYLLARHPEKLARAQAEIDTIMERNSGKLSEAGLAKLDYLNSVILETLRFCPPMAGLQRISSDRDVLEGWSIPAGQVVGITLQPLHHNPEYFGDRAEQFHPERYLDNEPTLVSVGAATATESQKQCPFKRFFTLDREDTNRKTKAGVYFPLTFGDGARRCLGEHFAMYEMKVVLAILLYHFDFQVAPNYEAELELGKFGLFLTTFPKEGVEMVISHRIH